MIAGERVDGENKTSPAWWLKHLYEYHFVEDILYRKTPTLCPSQLWNEQGTASEIDGDEKVQSQRDEKHQQMGFVCHVF